MNTTEHCGGCVDDFYNDHNPYGIKRCWHLDTAQLVERFRIPISRPPPYTDLKPCKVLNCRHEDGYVLVSVDSLTPDQSRWAT